MSADWTNAGAELLRAIERYDAAPPTVHAEVTERALVALLERIPAGRIVEILRRETALTVSEPPDPDDFADLPF